MGVYMMSTYKLNLLLFTTLLVLALVPSSVFSTSNTATANFNRRQGSFKIATFSSSDYCPELPPANNGVIVECRQKGQIKSEKCKLNEPNGSEAFYRCGDYHLTSEGDYIGGTLICENGRWTRLKSYQDFSCIVQCGMSANSFEVRTARKFKGFSPATGVQTTREEYPWVASIFFQDVFSGNFDFKCFGSLINPSNKGFLVLTAAHCLLETNSSYIENPQNIRVVLGATSRYYAENVADLKAQFFTVKNIEINPDFRSHRNEADIGVIFLKENLILSDQVLPVCFPNRGNQIISKQQVKPGVNGELLGFEIDDATKPLRNIKMPVADAELCRDIFNKFPSHSEFCAGSGDGATSEQKVCIGDNGGGLYFSEFSGSPPKYYVQGIVTKNPNRKPRGTCFNYGYFTRVSSYANWVHDVLDNQISFEMEQTFSFTPSKSKTTKSPYQYNQQQNNNYKSTTTTTAIYTTSTTRRPFIESTKKPLNNQPKPKSTFKPDLKSTSAPTISTTRKTSIVPSSRRTASPLLESTTANQYQSSSSLVEGGDFRKIGLEVHNTFRRKHGVPEFQLSQTLNEEAQNWVDYLIRENKKFLSRRTEFGKNLFEAKGYTKNDSDMVKLAIERWYSQNTDYNYTEPFSSPSHEKWLSFTQMIWKDSKEIGVGIGRKGDRVVVVVTYAPAGNILGENGKYFRDNVFPPNAVVLKVVK